MTFLPQAGWLLAAKDSTHLWFVFHSGEDGVLAIDLTREHPDIAYRNFQSVLDGEDVKPDSEKIVLLGGPLQPDDALIILHETQNATEESRIINEDFAFLSYRYVLLPGRPPVLAGADNRPSRIELKGKTKFIVAMGFRAWTAEELTDEMELGFWMSVPATADIIFDTTRTQRYARACSILN